MMKIRIGEVKEDESNLKWLKSSQATQFKLAMSLVAKSGDFEALEKLSNQSNTKSSLDIETSVEVPRKTRSNIQNFVIQ